MGRTQDPLTEKLSISLGYLRISGNPNPKPLLSPDYALGDSQKQVFETDLSTCSREIVQIVTSLMASFT